MADEEGCSCSRCSLLADIRSKQPSSDDRTRCGVPEVWRGALEFVREFIAVGGNGEGWTLDHVDAVAALALYSYGTTCRQRTLAKGVMGEKWIAEADGR